MKQRIPKAIYSKDFREQAVKQVTVEVLGLQEAAKRFYVGPLVTSREKWREWQVAASADGNRVGTGQD